MLSWLLHEDDLTVDDELALTVLNYLLLGTPTSTLYKPLIESGLGAALMGGGVSDELKQATFSIGLKGVQGDDVPKVEALVVETLQKAAAEGFEADAIEASLNTIEFSLREFNTGGYPKGLSLMLAVMPNWLYGRGSPTDALRFEKPLARLKERLSNGDKVFEELLSKLIVNNEHLATVELVPDTSLAEAQRVAEEDELADAKAKMSGEEIEGVVRSTRELKEAQLKEDSEADLSTIPRVGLADIEREVKTYPTILDALPGGGELLTHPLPCAGVVYADVLLDMTKLPLEDLPLARLFAALLDEVGTSDMSAVRLQRRIGARTGGLSTAIIYEQPIGKDGTVADPLDLVAYLAVRGKATADKADDLFGLMHSLLADANLEKAQPKVIELLRETQSNLETAFISSGNAFAGARLRARHTLHGYVGELTQGVTYYGEVKAMLAQAKDDWPTLLARMQTLRDTLLSQDGLVINLTTDPVAIASVRPIVDAFASKLPPTPKVQPQAAEWRDAVVPKLLPNVDEAFGITTQVHYVAAGANLFPAGTKVDGAFYTVARFLSRGYLWDNVRVVGGAYGGGCSLNQNTGVLSFSSYRDPNLQGTLDIYDKTADVLETLELTDEAIEQAIVGAVSDLDSPMTSKAKGYRALTLHLTGLTTEMRQEFRDEVLATSRESFTAFAKALRNVPTKVAIFGAKEALEQVNAVRAADEQIAVTQLS